MATTLLNIIPAFCVWLVLLTPTTPASELQPSDVSWWLSQAHTASIGMLSFDQMDQLDHFEALAMIAGLHHRNGDLEIAQKYLNDALDWQGRQVFEDDFDQWMADTVLIEAAGAAYSIGGLKYTLNILDRMQNPSHRIDAITWVVMYDLSHRGHSGELIQCVEHLDTFTEQAQAYAPNLVQQLPPDEDPSWYAHDPTHGYYEVVEYSSRLGLDDITDTFLGRLQADPNTTPEALGGVYAIAAARVFERDPTSPRGQQFLDQALALKDQAENPAAYMDSVASDLADTYASQGDLDQALTMVKRINAVEDASPQVWALADVLRAQLAEGNIQTATMTCTQAVTVGLMDEWANYSFHELGRVLGQSNNPQLLEWAAQTSITLESARHRCWLAAGVAYGLLLAANTDKADK